MYNAVFFTPFLFFCTLCLLSIFVSLFPYIIQSKVQTQYSDQQKLTVHVVNCKNVSLSFLSFIHPKDEFSWSLRFTFMPDKGKPLKSYYTPKFSNRSPPKSIYIKTYKVLSVSIQKKVACHFRDILPYLASNLIKLNIHQEGQNMRFFLYIATWNMQVYNNLVKHTFFVLAFTLTADKKHRMYLFAFTQQFRQIYNCLSDLVLICIYQASDNPQI